MISCILSANKRMEGEHSDKSPPFQSWTGGRGWTRLTLAQSTLNHPHSFDGNIPIVYFISMFMF